MGSKKLNIAKESSVTFASKILVFGFQAVMAVIAARILLPSGKGVVAALNGYTTVFFIVGHLSLSTSILHHFKNKDYSMGDFAGTALCQSMVVGSLLIAFFHISYYVWGGALYENVSYPLLAANFVWILPLLLHTYFAAILQASGKIMRMNLTILIGQGLGVVFLIVLLVILELGVLGVVIKNCLSFSISAVIIVYFVAKICPIREWKLNRKLLGCSLTDGLKLHIGTVAVYLYTKFDILMINSYLEKKDTGYYSVAVQLAELLLFVPLAVQVALYPRTDKITSEKETEEVITRCSRHTLYLSAIVGVFLFLFARFFILIFGKGYLPGLSSARLMIPGLVLQALTVTLAVLLVRKGRLFLMSAIAIINSVINISLNIILIPRLGIYGAAIATTFTYVLNFIIFLIVYERLTNRPASALLKITKQDILYYRNIIGNVRERLLNR